VRLYQGRWQDTVADEQADHLIIDAPYSERVHANSGYKGDSQGTGHRAKVSKLYAHWGREEVAEVCAWAKAHVRHWVVILTDHILFPIWEAELQAQGYLVFAPVILVETNRTVRLAGDGPACWATMMVVARPRGADFAKWRSLPGAYVTHRTNDKMQGGKALEVMRQIVRDYSNPGDRIVDLTAGFGTTLLAAAIEGRKAVGAEMDPDTYAKAKARMYERLHSPLFDGVEQPALF
jgi:site-specific DNA-methyltransferase (adenine-specific)